MRAEGGFIAGTPHAYAWGFIAFPALGREGAEGLHELTSATQMFQTACVPTAMPKPLKTYSPPR